MVVCRSRFRRSSSSRNSTLPSGSRPLMGSSSSRNSGWFIRARASPSRCFMPREKVLNFFFPVSVRRTSSRASSTHSLPGMPR